MALFTVVLLSSATLGSAQQPDAYNLIFGGSYDKLAPQQQELVRRWFAEYKKITGKEVDPEQGYDSLSLSARTTLEAVTHALLKTNLSDSNGKPLGNALSLVKLVESVHGEIPNTRGDQQFRIYVLLSDDALDKLYASTQFKRIGDNSVYHIGYPINFRQQGGTPSIQVSVTRTGLRADIDVDYRSSSGPAALVNGHLTSANSDVRAGGNYAKHVHRWSGFGDWWKSLFGAPASIPQSDINALSSQYTKPRVNDSQNVEVAVHDFYQSWFVEGRPELSMSYLSVKANACVAEYGGGESARSSLVRLRVYEKMKQASRKRGKAASLDQVMRGTQLVGRGARPVEQPYGKIFGISQLPDDVARSLDCRKTLGVPLAEDLPQASNTYGHFYGVSTLLKDKDANRPSQLLYQIWARQEGFWKVVSWYLEDPFQLLDEPAVSAPEKVVAVASSTAGDPDLAQAVDSLLHAWLLDRNIAVAAKYFAPESLSCGQVELGNSKSPTSPTSAGLTQRWVQQVASAIPKGSKLDAAIQSVPFDPNHKEKVVHRHEGAYLLLRVSDDLARMSSCSFRGSGKAVSRDSSTGEATFQLNEYQVIFEPRHEQGDRGAVVLTWAQRNGRWVVVAFETGHY